MHNKKADLYPSFMEMCIAAIVFSLSKQICELTQGLAVSELEVS